MAKLRYWDDIDSMPESLLQHGHVKLPSLNHSTLDAIATNINIEMDGETFVELSPSHKGFLEELQLNRFLTPKLYEIAKSEFVTGEVTDQYHIARRVAPEILKKCLQSSL